MEAPRPGEWWCGEQVGVVQVTHIAQDFVHYQILDVSSLDPDWFPSLCALGDWLAYFRACSTEESEQARSAAPWLAPELAREAALVRSAFLLSKMETSRAEEMARRCAHQCKRLQAALLDCSVTGNLIVDAEMSMKQSFAMLHAAIEILFPVGSMVALSDNPGGNFGRVVEICSPDDPSIFVKVHDLSGEGTVTSHKYSDLISLEDSDEDLDDLEDSDEDLDDLEDSDD